MKKQRPAKMVTIYGKIIEENAKKIPGAFDIEMIHDLRVAFKKLRSFLRLLQVDRKELKMPDELKKIYRSCGAVRDLQLVLQKLKDQEAGLPSFIRSLHHDLFTAKELLVMHIEDTSIKKCLKALEAALPADLPESTIRQFLHRKIAAIHILLLALESEEELHAIRKALKDLVYVKKILSTELSSGYPFNEWASDKKLEELAAMLGNLNDQCILLSIVSQARIMEAPAAEQQCLSGLREQWQEEKNAAQLNAISQVKKLAGFFKVQPAQPA